MAAKLLGISACLTAAVCYAGELPRPIPTIDWDTTINKFQFDAEKFVGQRLTVRCPPAPKGLSHDKIFGDGYYPSETPICVAALHAGEITREEGGVITLQLNPGRESYSASKRNGIETGDLPATARCIAFVNESTDAELTAFQVANLPTITWDTKFTRSGCAYRHLIGQQFTFRCPPAPADVRSRLVYGTDTYGFSSNICLAAMHAGELTKEGGLVTVRITGKAGRLTGSIRNGVETKSKNGGDRSIVFVASDPNGAP